MSDQYEQRGIDLYSFDDGTEPEEQEETVEEDFAEEETQPSLEEMLEQIDAISSEMEEGDLSLEESFRKYKQGMDLVKQCSKEISRVEKQIQVLDEEGELHEF